MNDNKYLPTIGLEIHAELKTGSKMFCACKNDPDEEKENTNICPICLGHPGTLPVLNMDAIKKVIQVGLGVGGTVADFTEWDRKNYFYPDIPKGYQISQYRYPLIKGGMLAGVEIERIHLEEDTAKSTHDTHEMSLVNFDRSGVPLMELVTKPVIHDAATAVRFAKELQLLLRYLGAGFANMEKGEMRVEANISVSSSSILGTKTEVKNLNSFRTVEKAITYEIERQTSLLENGEQVKQETRGWDETKQETYSQRSKESSHDYRYFPDPDIPKLKISEMKELDKDVLVKELPELPWQKRERFMTSYGMTEKEVAIFVETTSIADYFDTIVRSFMGDAKKIRLATNYLLSDYLGVLKTKKLEFVTEHAIEPKIFAEMINMISEGLLSSRGAKDLILLLIDAPSSNPQELAEKNGLIQKSDLSLLMPAIEKVIADNKKVVDEYRGGKLTSLQFLIGQAMKATKGSGNPEIVKKLLLEKLS